MVIYYYILLMMIYDKSILEHTLEVRTLMRKWLGVLKYHINHL